MRFCKHPSIQSFWHDHSCFKRVTCAMVNIYFLAHAALERSFVELRNHFKKLLKLETCNANQNYKGEVFSTLIVGLPGEVLADIPPSNMMKTISSVVYLWLILHVSPKCSLRLQAPSIIFHSYSSKYPLLHWQWLSSEAFVVPPRPPQASFSGCRMQSLPWWRARVVDPNFPRRNWSKALAAEPKSERTTPLTNSFVKSVVLCWWGAVVPISLMVNRRHSSSTALFEGSLAICCFWVASPATKVLHAPKATLV